MATCIPTTNEGPLVHCGATKSNIKRSSMVVAVLVLGVVAWYSAQRVWACQCLPPPSIPDQFELAEVVFLGEFLEVDLAVLPGVEYPMWLMHFRVLASWKGVRSRQVCVATPGTPSCGLKPPEPGTQLLMYASGSTAAIVATQCSRTGQLAGALQDIQYFPSLAHLPLPLDGPEVGNFDGDELLELSDYAYAANCITGPYGAEDGSLPVHSGPCCTIADSDTDLDIDLADFAAIQRAWAFE